MSVKSNNISSNSTFYNIKKINDDIVISTVTGKTFLDSNIYSLEQFLQLVDPSKRDELSKLYQKALGYDGIYEIIYPMILPNSTKISVFDTFYSSNGIVNGVINHSQVITEDSAFKILQLIIDALQVGIVLINEETMEIELVNNLFLELMMTNSSTVINQKCNNIICKRDLCYCPHIIEANTTVIGERFLKREDGTIVPVINYGTRIEFANKRFFVNSFVDLSMQKRLERNLFEAKQAADFANKSKTEFLSNMSHEMRTPLNAVIGMTQIAKKTNDIAKLKNNLDIIEVSSKHLLNLINDILDLSKIEEGKLELLHEDFSLKEMIDRILVVIKPKIEEKNIDFKYEQNGDLVNWVNGDSMRLSQAILNFLSNAVKFTKNNNKVTFTLSGLGIINNKIKLEFKIIDTGIGMSEEQVEKLFKPFQQADSKISRKYGGTGLGLAISKKIINLMGSDINVTTKLGDGSTFSFEIILPIAEQINIDKEEIIDDLNDIFLYKKALLVDDLEINRIVAKELLFDTGLTMDEAVDGQDAIDKFLANEYDIILMDVQMPIMDGYTATKAIRKLGIKGQNIPIIAMSANVFKEDVEKSLQAGMNDHIGKPIDLMNCVNIINKWLTQTYKKNIVWINYQLDDDSLIILKGSHFIDLTAALSLHHDNKQALAQEIYDFIHFDYVKKIDECAKKDDDVLFSELFYCLLERANKLQLLNILKDCELIDTHLKANNFTYVRISLPILMENLVKTVEILKTTITSND